MAIDSLGRAFAWGKDSCGELGLGKSNIKVDIPQIISNEQSLVFKSVKVKLGFSILLSNGGYLYIAGSLKDNISAENQIRNRLEKIDSLETEVITGFIITKNKKMIVINIHEKIIILDRDMKKG